VRQIRARYLVGADGSHSPTREALGIRMLGQPALAYRVNMLFRADLARWVGDREINICFIVHSEGADMLLYNGGNRWQIKDSEIRIAAWVTLSLPNYDQKDGNKRDLAGSLPCQVSLGLLARNLY
jgi:hypothetical protein